MSLRIKGNIYVYMWIKPDFLKVKWGVLSIGTIRSKQGVFGASLSVWLSYLEKNFLGLLRNTL